MKNKINTPIAFLFFVSSQLIYAGSATWNLSPTSGDWNTAANWTPATVPNGSNDIATFALSNTTAVSLSASVTVNSIVFNSGASAFTISPAPTSTKLTVSGAGITNNSGTTENFLAAANNTNDSGFIFSNNATAGSGTVFTMQAGMPAGGYVD